MAVGQRCRQRFLLCQRKQEVHTEKHHLIQQDQTAEVHQQSRSTSSLHQPMGIDQALLLQTVKQIHSVNVETSMTFYYMDKNLCALILIQERELMNLLCIRETGSMLISNSRMGEGGFGLIHLQTRCRGLCHGHVFARLPQHLSDFSLLVSVLRKEGWGNELDI